MGLCSHLNDVSSDSIPILFVAIIANCVCYIRTLFYGVFKSMGFSSGFDSVLVNDVVDEELFGSSSGLAGLVVLTEQLKMNPVFVYKQDEDEDEDEDEDDDDGLQCVVCLCRLRDGDHVRKLACRHVFHKDCLDSWLFDHCNLTCPLCRSPLVSNHRQLVAADQTRLFGGFIPWFSMR